MAKLKNQKQQILVSPSRERKRGLLVLAFLMLLNFIHAEQFKFIQDDAFITFRYIKNFIAGNGLVFNIGERVEGYTTFLWTILLALPAQVGFDLIAASQYLGVFFGLATLYVLYRLSLDMGPPARPFGFALIAVLMYTASSAAAYWSISGMESGLFTFLTVLCVWLYLRERNERKNFNSTPVVFFLLSLTRPEGMFLFGLTMLHFVYETLRTQGDERARRLKKMFIWIGIYVVPTAVFTLWRLSYYGYFFPNTFYAKAGISKEYFSAGLDYFINFAQNYLFWGAVFAIPTYLLIKRKWQSSILYLVFLIAAYTGYVIIVGGDVLPAFRFFIPILPLIYLLVQEGLYEFYQTMEAKNSRRKYLTYLVPLVLTYYIYVTPQEYVRRYWELENGLVRKMTAHGLWLKSHASPTTVIAASTIGAISYYSDLTLIDMLGLTDETIAHHPEQIFGVKSGWKERNYNATYVLSRKPDWICFSTGFKPSAFAERALFLKKEFRQWYYPYYFHPSGDANEVGIMYKRAEKPLPEVEPGSEKSVNNEFINNYYDGVNRMSRWPKDALEYFHKAMQQAPKDFALLYEAIGSTYRAQQNFSAAARFYEQAIAIDPRLVESRMMAGYFALQNKDFESARKHFEALTFYDPDYAMGWTLLGDTYRSLNDITRAKAAYEQALRLTPNNADAARALQQLSG